MSMTDEEFRDYILSAPTLAELDNLHGEEGYDAAGRLAAKMVYEHLEHYPEDNQLEIWDLYDRVVVTHPDLDAVDVTGFMWGYAVQSAEHLLKMPLKPNPALLTLSLPE